MESGLLVCINFFLILGLLALLVTSIMKINFYEKKTRDCSLHHGGYYCKNCEYCSIEYRLWKIYTVCDTSSKEKLFTCNYPIECHRLTIWGYVLGATLIVIAIVLKCQ